VRRFEPDAQPSGADAEACGSPEDGIAMSTADRMLLARRPFLAGLMGVLALAGLAWEAPKVFPKLFARRYPPSPFDDLLALLPDRENAVRLGGALDGGRNLDAR